MAKRMNIQELAEELANSERAQATEVADDKDYAELDDLMGRDASQKERKIFKRAFRDAARRRCRRA